ncbi:MAG: SDR family NAD(P)-dependent oxidoreductase [Polyangiaceae bacterium]|nr:SDR family NAD(P)-dependent oxidoreductase [Polyangiaceae bacterium]
MVGHLVITGTSGSIGAALARALRARHPGAAMSLLDVDLARSRALAGALGGDAVAVGCDLSSSDDAARALDEARAARGPVTGLVNCAGVMEVAALERLEWAKAEALLAIDLVSPLRLLHASTPELLRARGFVVNVSSMAGAVTLSGCAFYGAAKAGLAMASEIARHELAPRGVRVVTVYPGPVASALEARAKAQYGGGWLTRALPTGDADELARLVVTALDRGRARVIYPRVYGLGRLPFAGAVARAIGPRPSG